VFCVEVQVVVAGYVQPRHAETGGGAVERRIQRRVVVGDVAQGHAEVGAVATRQRRHDRIPVVADLAHVAGLRIAEHQHFQNPTF